MAERITIARKYIEEGYPVQKVIRYAGVASSTWYKSLQKKSEDKRQKNKGRPVPGYSINPDGTVVADRLVVVALKKYREKEEFKNAGGYHKLKHYLKRDYGFHINKKKIYRLCKEHNLLLPKKKTSKWRQRKISINRVVSAPNQLWEFDIKYGYIHGENRFFFLLAFIDVFTRKVIDFYVGKSCKSKDLSFTLDEALRKASLPPENGLVIRSDHGSQMTSNMFRTHLKNIEINLEHEFIPCGNPNKNAHIESFNSIFEVEFLQVRYFNNFAEAYEQTCKFIEFYNQKRVHGSLKYHTPSEAYNLLLGGDLQLKEVYL